MESKKLPAPIVVPSELKDLSSQIEQWRRTRPRLGAMPDALWTLAGSGAGLSRYPKIKPALSIRLLSRVPGPPGQSQRGLFNAAR